MSEKPVHRVHVFFNAQSQPYMYGAVHIVDGSVDNQWWEKPFVVSRRKPGGQEVVYGTVHRTMEKIVSQLNRLRKFYVDSQAEMAASGVSPLPPERAISPESELEVRIMDEQEELVEDVLSSVSVNVRILSEIFPDKLQTYKVNVYNYEHAHVGEIELSEIANLLVHNRYVVVRGQYLEDLISDRKFMSSRPVMGLRVDFEEYFEEVNKVVTGITVGDLAEKLRDLMDDLTTSSSVKDIIFLTQNLYNLGGAVLESGRPVHSGPLNTIFNRIGRQHLDSVYPKTPEFSDVSVDVTFVFRTPRFYLQPDLDHKQIRVEVEVNGKTEKLVMDYEDFFSEVSEAAGDMKLYTGSLG